MKKGTQPLRAVNRIPFSSPTLKLDNSSPLAGHISAGMQIHHPKGNKRLTFLLHLQLNKPKQARVVITIHHGHKTKAVAFPFGKNTAGEKKIRVQTPPQEGMGGAHLISVHGYAQRKSSKVRVELRFKSVDVS